MPANKLRSEIHNAKQRVPAILKREGREAWLSGSTEEPKATLVPFSMRA